MNTLSIVYKVNFRPPGKYPQIRLFTDIREGGDGLPGVIEVMNQVTVVNCKNRNTLETYM